jgi:hypothetical protein
MSYDSWKAREPVVHWDDPDPTLWGGGCEGGTIFVPDPKPDDPYFMREVGPCPDWPGCGCQYDLPEIRDGEPLP